MDHFDSDLEEGEIIDDSPSFPNFNDNKQKDSPPFSNLNDKKRKELPPFPNFNNNRRKELLPFPNFNDSKRKELPQRYVVGDNKSSIEHKHKKGCKHAIRYHAKKLSKLKKTPPKKKDIPKRHKPSCIYEKSHKVPNRRDSSDTVKSQNAHSKNGCFSQNSLIAEMKGSLKNVPPFSKVNTNIDKPKIEIISIANQNLKTHENNSATLKTSSAKTHKDRNCKPSNVYLIDLTVTPSSVTSIELKQDSNIQLIDLSNSPNEESSITELNSNDVVKNVDTIVSNNIVQSKDEESEDEEELRRIALATFVKRKALTESQNIGSPCNETVSGDAKYDDNVHSCLQETKNPTGDNYEVVDMEVDNDMPDSLENDNAQTSLINKTSEYNENLFVIDTNPSNDFLQNKENSVSKPQTTCNSSDEEFETNILRAELITSMYRKLLKKDNSEKLNVPSPEKQVTAAIQPKKSLVNYQAQNLFRNKRLKSAKHFLRKRSVSKLGSIKKNNNVIPLPVLPDQPKKSEFIIRINGESSDDSDDNSEPETNTVSENPEESIVALISDCRQKSESNVETKEDEIVPQAVAYLSKAMQEEYNSYMKILAKKKNLPAATQTLSPKNGLVRTPLDDLNKLEDKLKGIRDALENKKKSMSALSEEVNSKKHIYMKAKLTAQHLKEQLIAAEKARKEKLLEWSKTCDKLKSMKKSVSDLEDKMNEVQNLCSKIGSSLQGQSYKLPLQNEKS